MSKIKTPTLSAEDIVKRLEKADEKVVNEVYDLATKQLAAEDTLATRLDSKATALLSVAGFSMTIAFSFGGWSLLDNIKKIALGKSIAVALVVVLVVGLVTCLFAWIALRMRKNYKWIDENEVFHEGVLSKKDTATYDYKIHMATHQWLIWQKRFAITEERAKWTSYGQLSFVVFLSGILALSCLTTYSAIQLTAPKTATSSSSSAGAVPPPAHSAPLVGAK